MIKNAVSSSRNAWYLQQDIQDAHAFSYLAVTVKYTSALSDARGVVLCNPRGDVPQFSVCAGCGVDEELWTAPKEAISCSNLRKFAGV
jgi:hypothetical protein